MTSQKENEDVLEKTMDEAQEGPEEESVSEEKKKVTPLEEEFASFVDRFSLPSKEKASLERIKMIIDSRIDNMLNDILSSFNIIVRKTFIKDESGKILLDKNGNPLQDWTNVDISDIKTILLKIPLIQLQLASIEVDSWAEAELAKLLREESFERIYSEQISGTEGKKKNVAYLHTLEDNYRAFFLKYANKRIQALNESLSRITDKWSRVVEILKIESLVK